MSEWNEKRMGSFCTFRYGKMPSEDIKIDNAIYPIFSGYRITGHCSEYNVEKGKLVVVARGVGGTGDVKITPERCYLTNLAIAFDINENIASIKYLYYLFAPSRLRYLDSGAAQSQITISDLQRVKVNLPPLPTQTRIAEILSAYDDAIENNNRRIALLEKAAREIYQEWFVRMRFPGHENTKIVNGLPEGWEIKRLSDISDFKYGTMPNAEKVKESGYPIFSGYRVTGYYDEYMFEKEQLVLIARGVGGTGEVRISPPFCYLTNLSIAFLLKYDVYKLYLYEMFQLQNLRYLDTGAAQSQITIENLRRCKVVMPMHDLLKKYSNTVCEFYDLKSKLHTQSQNLARQRDLLLPRLMSGKLEV